MCKKFLQNLPVNQGTFVTDRQTTDRRQPYHKLDRYLGTVG